MNLYNETLAAKDAEIATLKACVEAYRQSLKDHALHMDALLVDPAQPAAPMEGFLLIAMRRALALIDNSPLQAKRALQMAVGGDAHIAQPAAAVSAPTDEPEAWSVKLHDGRRVGMVYSEQAAKDTAASYGNASTITPLYVRAAAPVSGPTDARFSQVWNDALNEAALICDGVNNHDNPMTVSDCADAIRAMRTAP